MSTGPLLDAVPPGDRHRAVRTFRPNTLAASIAAVGSVAIAGCTWWALAFFDNSLAVSDEQLVIARLAELLLGVVTLVVPFYGVRAALATRRAYSLSRRGDILEARTAVEDSRDAIWNVVGLGLFALLLAFGAWFFAANDGRVREVLFDWSLIWKTRRVLWRGFWFNIKLFVAAQSIVLVWALLVAVVRQMPGRAFLPLRALAITYCDVLRGVPAIIVIYLVVFGFQLAEVPPFDGWDKGTQLFWLSVFALVMVYGAYVAEVYRAGIESVHSSQVAAARGLGLNQSQTMRFVVLPQAVRRIIPPLLNDFVALQKDTALVSVVGIVEIFNKSVQLKNQYFNLSVVSGAAFFFLIVTIPFTRLVDYLLHRDQQQRQANT